MRDYKTIWDNLSVNLADANFFVCCVGDEDEIRTNGSRTAEFLCSILEITPADSVLEIGCGVGRIGRELAPACREWHGADISGNMIAHARERTADLPNVFLHELPENSLSIFPDNSFDCVYSSIVFMHIDKIDMFAYMCEACRVLKPGGRAYFDTYNLLAPEAWEEFLKNVRAFPYGYRPAHMSQFSTLPEMRKFLHEAGFIEFTMDDSNPQLVVAVGHKPQASAEDTPSRRVAFAPPIPLAALNAATDPEIHVYARYLEAEIARKNEALADLTARLAKRERELDRARQPRLPWKRRARRH